MAKFVVPPKKPYKVILLKCYRCGALYSPEGKQKSYLRSECYEDCPECGYDHNSDGQRISLWMYNWLKWWRGTTKEEEKTDMPLSEEVDKLKSNIEECAEELRHIGITFNMQKMAQEEKERR